MGFMEDEKLVEAFFADGTDPAFSVRIRIRRSNGRMDHFDPFHCEDRVKHGCEPTISIMDLKRLHGFA